MTKSINKTTLLHSHLLFSIAQSTQKKSKVSAFQRIDKKRNLTEMLSIKELAAYISAYPKGWFSYSKESFVVNETLVFQIAFCLKCYALWVAAKRKKIIKLMLINNSYTFY